MRCVFWGLFLEAFFQGISSSSEGTLVCSGSHLVTAHRGTCALARSLALRQELGTWGTWMDGPRSSSKDARGHIQTQIFSWRKNVKIFCIAMSNIYIYVCFIETFTRTLYFPEHYISWGTLAIQSFHFWWKQKGNDHDFSGSESLIFYCPSCIYKQVNREKFLLSCFPLSYVTALLVAPCRWVQSTSWPWHHATENRLMRQRKQGSLFCREAGSDHLVVVKTDHTELFCFVRDEFHSVTACLSDIL